MQFPLNVEHSTPSCAPRYPSLSFSIALTRSPSLSYLGSADYLCWYIFIHSIFALCSTHSQPIVVFSDALHTNDKIKSSQLKLNLRKNTIFALNSYIEIFTAQISRIESYASSRICMSWILKKYLADFASDIQISREMGMEFHLNPSILILLYRTDFSIFFFWLGNLLSFTTTRSHRTELGETAFRYE